MPKLMQAVRAVAPVWLMLCGIALFFGWTMQQYPGMMEAASFYPTTWAGNLAHYDPHSYLLIAEQGYGAEGRDFQSSVRFPLMPFLTRTLMQVLRLDGYVAMFVLTKAALFVGLIGVWLLAAHEEMPEQANRVILYFAFPLLGSGYTWLMSYPEALYLAFWTFGFWLALRQRYYLAGLVTVLAIWTRPHAIVILPAFAVLLIVAAVREHGWRGLLTAELWRRGLLTCGLPLLAYMAWMLHISRLTEIPLSPITAQASYGRGNLLLPWLRVADYLALPFSDPLMQWGWAAVLTYYQLVLILVSLVVLGISAWRRRLNWGIAVFSLLSILPGLSTELYAVSRFALLTWIPAAVSDIIPKRFDAVIVPLGAALTVLILIVVNLRSLQI